MYIIYKTAGKYHWNRVKKNNLTCCGYVHYHSRPEATRLFSGHPGCQVT